MYQNTFLYLYVIIWLTHTFVLSRAGICIIFSSLNNDFIRFTFKRYMAELLSITSKLSENRLFASPKKNILYIYIHGNW